MRVDGRCHCGEVAYEAIVDPSRVGICHCTDCQALTGSAYRVTVQASKDAFFLRAGQPTIYVKTADSGATRAHAFCPRCGSPVYSAATSNPQTYSLRVGCLRQRAELLPRVQQWCQSALPWAMDLSEIPQVTRQ
ncbi:MAG TPA: GFA family protein [Myxococcota bacterium]|nr:GFA family protein [Myxococcota bacterium]